MLLTIITGRLRAVAVIPRRWSSLSKGMPSSEGYRRISSRVSAGGGFRERDIVGSLGPAIRSERVVVTRLMDGTGPLRDLEGILERKPYGTIFTLRHIDVQSIILRKNDRRGGAGGLAGYGRLQRTRAPSVVRWRRSMRRKAEDTSWRDAAAARFFIFLRTQRGKRQPTAPPTTRDAPSFPSLPSVPFFVFPRPREGRVSPMHRGFNDRRARMRSRSDRNQNTSENPSITWSALKSMSPDRRSMTDPNVLRTVTSASPTAQS